MADQNETTEVKNIRPTEGIPLRREEHPAVTYVVDDSANRTGSKPIVGKNPKKEG